MRLGLAIPSTGRIGGETTLRAVQAAERLGYSRIWVAEEYGSDAFTVLTSFACHTERIEIATGIVNVFSRSPALIAQTAASLDRISGGRFVLGLGTSGHQVVEGWYGVRYERGVRRLRETVEIVRAVVRHERLVYDGDVFRLAGGLKLTIRPLRDRIPIYLATLTPSGVALAGELADGWMPLLFSPAHFDTVFRPELERGAARSGRSLCDLEICVLQRVVVTDDVEAGRDAVRPSLALFVGGMGSRQKNYYADLFGRYGYADEARRIQERYLEGRLDEAMAAVTDEMIDDVAIIGPAPECRRRLAELESIGVTEVAIGLQVPGAGAPETVQALADLAAAEVRPAGGDGGRSAAP